MKSLNPSFAGSYSLIHVHQFISGYYGICLNPSFAGSYSLIKTIIVIGIIVVVS